MFKKLTKEEESRKQMKRQSFFFVGSIPELIIVSILIILAWVYSSVFLADGVVFTKILKDAKSTAPDKNQVVAKLEKRKSIRGRYPSSLGQIGVGEKYGTVVLEYASSGGEFELCYTYFPFLNNMASCYYSKDGEWERR